ncbi:hypothetical protein X961_5822 [Burkholderia pseudomallei MSHR5613]|nr:hypothetical protein X961_5822 [Burkholderia pseudomallei MSHR5613]
MWRFLHIIELWRKRHFRGVIGSLAGYGERKNLAPFMSQRGRRNCLGL